MSSLSSELKALPSLYCPEAMGIIANHFKEACGPQLTAAFSTLTSADICALLDVIIEYERVDEIPKRAIERALHRRLIDKTEFYDTNAKAQNLYCFIRESGADPKIKEILTFAREHMHKIIAFPKAVEILDDVATHFMHCTDYSSTKARDFLTSHDDYIMFVSRDLHYAGGKFFPIHEFISYTLLRACPVCDNSVEPSSTDSSRWLAFRLAIVWDFAKFLGFGPDWLKDNITNLI